VTSSTIFGARTQLDGTMKVFAELATPEFRAARLFVEHELKEKMGDARFVKQLDLPFQASMKARTKRFS
jgi:hypothetical protein